MSDETMFAITTAERQIINETLAHYAQLVRWADKVVTMHGTGDERHESLIASLAKHRQTITGASRINLREIPQPEEQKPWELPDGMIPESKEESE